MIGQVVVDLEAEEPTFYWTFTLIADYKSNNAVWKADKLGPPIITPTAIHFDYLDGEWEPSCNPVKMVLESDGYFHSRNRTEWKNEKDHHYFGLRSESSTHVVIVGNWLDEGFGNGAFIAVLPKAANPT